MRTDQVDPNVKVLLADLIDTRQAKLLQRDFFKISKRWPREEQMQFVTSFIHMSLNRLSFGSEVKEEQIYQQALSYYRRTETSKDA